MAIKHPLTNMYIPLGVIPQILMANEEKKKPKKSANPVEAAMEGIPTGMAKGGKVGRGDGCCIKGKTKGKMC